jgi:hypothetical protein
MTFKRLRGYSVFCRNAHWLMSELLTGFVTTQTLTPRNWVFEKKQFIRCSAVDLTHCVAVQN